MGLEFSAGHRALKVVGGGRNWKVSSLLGVIFTCAGSDMGNSYILWKHSQLCTPRYYWFYLAYDWFNHILNAWLTE